MGEGGFPGYFALMRVVFLEICLLFVFLSPCNHKYAIYEALRIYKGVNHKKYLFCGACPSSKTTKMEFRIGKQDFIRFSKDVR